MRLRDPRHEQYFQRFKIKRTQRNLRKLNKRFLDQLDGCFDDAARKVILGIKK